MLRLLFLLFYILQTFVSANNEEVSLILQKLNSNPNNVAENKVYNRADLIYAEFKASE